MPLSPSASFWASSGVSGLSWPLPSIWTSWPATLIVVNLLFATFAVAVVVFCGPLLLANCRETTVIAAITRTAIAVMMINGRRGNLLADLANLVFFFFISHLICVINGLVVSLRETPGRLDLT